MLYITSIYWAFTTLTTVGYGDIGVETILEKNFSMVWMIFGVGFYSFNIGSLVCLLSRINTKEKALS